MIIYIYPNEMVVIVIVIAIVVVFGGGGGGGCGGGCRGGMRRGGGAGDIFYKIKSFHAKMIIRSIFILMVQIKTTANKGDVFMSFFFFWGGGVPKKLRF